MSIRSYHPDSLVEGNSNDPNIQLTRAVRHNRKALTGKVAQLLATTSFQGKTMSPQVQDQIRELEEAYMSVAREEASSAFDELTRRNLVRCVDFPETELGISFVLARFELLEDDDQDNKESDSALSRRLIVVEKTLEDRGGGIGHKVLCPTDELLGIQTGNSHRRRSDQSIRSTDFDLVVDPSVEDFAKILHRLRDAPRPLRLAFALGPQREEARRAMLAADRRAQKKAEARRAESMRRISQRTSLSSSSSSVRYQEEDAVLQKRRQEEAKLKKDHLQIEEERRRHHELKENERRRREEDEARLSKAALKLKEEEDALRFRREEQEDTVRKERLEVEARRRRLDREQDERRRELEREEDDLRERQRKEREASLKRRRDLEREKEEKERDFKEQQSQLHMSQAAQRRAREEAERAREALEAERLALETSRQAAEIQVRALRKEREDAMLETARKVATEASLADAAKAREIAADAHRKRTQAEADAQRSRESSPREAIERKRLAEEREASRDNERQQSLVSTEIYATRGRSLTPKKKRGEQSPLRVEQLETEDECLTAGPPSWTPSDYRQVTNTPQEYLGRLSSPLRALEESLIELRQRVEALERDRGLSKSESELRTALKEVSERLDSRKRLLQTDQPGSAGAKLEHEIRSLLAEARKRVDDIEAHDWRYDSIEVPSVDGDRNYFFDARRPISPALPPPPTSPPAHQEMRGIDREPQLGTHSSFSEGSRVSPPAAPLRSYISTPREPPARSYPRLMEDSTTASSPPLERRRTISSSPRLKSSQNTHTSSSYISPSTSILEPRLAEYDAPLWKPVDWENDAELRRKIEEGDSEDIATVQSRYQARLREIELSRRTRRLKAEALEAAKVAEEAISADRERKRLEREAKERQAERRAEAKRIAELKERERLARERLAMEKDRIEAGKAVALAMAEEERRDRVAKQKANAHKAMLEAQEARAASSALAIRLAEQERKERLEAQEAIYLINRREFLAQRAAAVAYAISAKDSEQIEGIEIQRELVSRVRTQEKSERARDKKLAVSAIETERLARLGEVATVRATEKRERQAEKKIANDLYDRELRRQLAIIRAAEIAALDAQRLARHEAISASEEESRRRLDVLSQTPARRPLVTSQIMRATMAAFLEGRESMLIHRFLNAQGRNSSHRPEQKDTQVFAAEREAFRVETMALRQQYALLKKKSKEQEDELHNVLRDLERARQDLTDQARQEVERRASESMQRDLDQSSLVKSRIYDKDLVHSLRTDLDEARYALALAQKKAATDISDLRSQLSIARDAPATTTKKNNEESARLRAELDSARAAVATISESAAKETALLRTELATLRKKNLNANQELSGTAAPSTAALAYEVAEKNQENLRLREELDQRKRQVSTSFADTERLRSELADARAALGRNDNAETKRLRSELIEARAALRKHEINSHDIQRLKSELAEAREEVFASSKHDTHELQRLRTELKETKAKFEKLQSNTQLLPPPHTTTMTTNTDEALRLELEETRAALAEAQANTNKNETITPSKAVERALEAARKEHTLEMNAARDAFNAAQRTSAEEIARLRLEAKAKKPLRSGRSDSDDDDDEDLRIGTEVQAEVQRAKTALADTQRKADLTIANLRAELDEAQDLIKAQQKQHAQRAKDLERLEKEVTKAKEGGSSIEPTIQSPSSGKDASPIDAYAVAATVNTAARSVADAERRANSAERQKAIKADELAAMHAVIDATRNRYQMALQSQKALYLKARSDLSITQAKLSEKSENKNDFDDQAGLTEELIATKLELAATKMQLDEIQHEHIKERAATKQLYAQQSAQRRAAATKSSPLATRGALSASAGRTSTPNKPSNRKTSSSSTSSR